MPTPRVVPRSHDMPKAATPNEDDKHDDPAPIVYTPAQLNWFVDMLRRALVVDASLS